MNKVYPNSHFTQFQFNCPKCGWIHWFTYNQLSSGKLHFVCDCKAVFTPTIKIKKLEKQKEEVTSELFDSLIRTLVKQGFSKREATIRVTDIFDSSKSVEQLLRDAVFYGHR